jgi:hypothetical protein
MKNRFGFNFIRGWQLRSLYAFREVLFWLLAQWWLGRRLSQQPHIFRLAEPYPSVDKSSKEAQLLSHLLL